MLEGLRACYLFHIIHTPTHHTKNPSSEKPKSEAAAIADIVEGGREVLSCFEGGFRIHLAGSWSLKGFVASVMRRQIAESAERNIIFNASQTSIQWINGRYVRLKRSIYRLKIWMKALFVGGTISIYFWKIIKNKVKHQNWWVGLGTYEHTNTQTTKMKRSLFTTPKQFSTLS